MNTSNLQDIENLMERSRKKRLLGFLGRHRDIAAEVYRLRDDLEDTIKLFMVRNYKYIYITFLLTKLFTDPNRPRHRSENRRAGECERPRATARRGFRTRRRDRRRGDQRHPRRYVEAGPAS